MSCEVPTKHSLWLKVPDLQSVVDQLAREASNPTFVPHLTLIGNFHGTSNEALDIATKIADAFKKRVAISLSGFGTKGEEFRYFCL